MNDCPHATKNTAGRIEELHISEGSSRQALILKAKGWMGKPLILIIVFTRRNGCIDIIRIWMLQSRLSRRTTGVVVRRKSLIHYGQTKLCTSSCSHH